MEHPKTTCTCNAYSQETKRRAFFNRIGKTTRPVPAIVTSILIALFPKCPLCWAVYMSMFGSFGLTRLPYMPWILPVLFLFLGIHLYVVVKKIPQKGYLPFAFSFAGAAVILSARIFFPYQPYLPGLAMLLIGAGSLLHSFTGRYLPLPFVKK
jgi:hypothetical protein